MLVTTESRLGRSPDPMAEDRKPALAGHICAAERVIPAPYGSGGEY